MAKKTTEQVALSDWGTWETNNNGNWTFNTIQTASLTFLAKEVRELKLTLNGIQRLLMSLGDDGLHVVIREHARQVRRAEERRRAQRRRRRALQKAQAQA